MGCYLVYQLANLELSEKVSEFRQIVNMESKSISYRCIRCVESLIRPPCVCNEENHYLICRRNKWLRITVITSSAINKVGWSWRSIIYQHVITPIYSERIERKANDRAVVDSDEPAAFHIVFIIVRIKGRRDYSIIWCQYQMAVYILKKNIKNGKYEERRQETQTWNKLQRNTKELAIA